MRDTTVPKISKWPFLVGDGLLLWTACFIYIESKVPMGFPELALAAACIAAGALLAIVPFILEYGAVVRLAEGEGLVSVVTKVNELEKIGAQIAEATGRWQLVQEVSEKTAASAKSIAERMTAEVKAFSEFMSRVNDSEISTLRLELEKSRRAENDWLHVLVRLLDHVHALHSASVRSGQPRLIEQLTNFQNACRDTTRRVGLVPFAAAPGDLFDTQRHQWLDGDGKPKTVPEGARIAELVAAGYTFQGRLLRAALVRVEETNGSSAADTAVQNQLPLDAPAPA